VSVAITDVGRRGRLDIAFGLCDGRTAIRHSYCEVPFKITRLLDSDMPGFAHLILMQCTAGLFGGDHIDCTIHVDSGARVLLTQQSATKIHPSGDLPATQRTRIYVESGAELIVDNEPAIPFAGSRFRQDTRIEAEAGARIVFWEGLMGGRIGKDEVWKFKDLMSETQMNVAGEPVYLDRFSLRPLQEDPASIWVMKNFSYVGTGLCFSEGCMQLADQLHQAMPGAGVDVLTPNLVAVRVASASGPDFHRYREAFRMHSAKFVLSSPSDFVPTCLPWQ
jgi:urease accessory protein